MDLSLRQNRYGRVEMMQTPHETAQSAHGGPVSTSLPGLSTIHSYGYQYFVHKITASYIADNPEPEDIFSVKREATGKTCLL